MGKQNRTRITVKELLALLPLEIIEEKATETKLKNFRSLLNVLLISIGIAVICLILLWLVAYHISAIE
jgi:ABC-type glycerol-3-phosphate transport system permease component